MIGTDWLFTPHRLLLYQQYFVFLTIYYKKIIPHSLKWILAGDTLIEVENCKYAAKCTKQISWTAHTLGKATKQKSILNILPLEAVKVIEMKHKRLQTIKFQINRPEANLHESL